MGRVFEARDVALDRAVAIKQSLTDDAQMLVRFEREALITAQLQHPGIVPVLDAGRDADGRPYYVMRKIEGRPLSTVVTEARTVGARLALLPNMLAAVDAVAYAHARGVIHRDLKPWNILLGPFGETFVIDWGLARDLAGDDTVGGSTPPSEDGLTRVGSAMGTPGFMAPEQARGEPIDRRADVYALGATLVHLLTAKQPFAGIEPTVVIEAVSRDEAPAIEFPDEVPSELRTIATKAMEPRRGERYADAGELAADLRRFLAGQLVAAHAYTWRERLTRWLRKHRIAVAIATLATLAVVAISTIAIRRVVVARDDARVAEDRAADRADAMLVERAYSLATTDPAYALALLKQLPAGSRAWPRALATAETAVAHGVGWGRPLTRPDGWVQIEGAPAGDVVAISSDETIYLVDPSLHTPPRVLAKLKSSISQFGWLDNESLIVVVGSTHELLRIRRDGSSQTLQTSSNNSLGLLTPILDHRVFVRTEGRLFEVDPDGGPVRTDFGPVKAAERVPGGLLYQVGEQMFVQPDGKLPEPVANHQLFGALIATDLVRGRIAIWDMREVIELERGAAGWTERARWLVDAIHVVYDTQRLIAIESVGIAYLVANQPPIRESIQISRDRSAIRGGVISSDAGVFIAGDHGVIALAGDRPALIAPFAERLFAFAKVGDYLVALTRTGTVRSWDLRNILPQRVPIKLGAHPLAVDDHRAWFGELEFTTAVDLETGKATERIGAAHYDESELMCAGPKTLVRLEANKRRILNQPALVVVLEPSGTLTPVPGDYTEAICTPTGRWLALQTASGIELRDARTPAVPGRVVPAANVRSFALTDRWLAIVEVAGAVTRIAIGSCATQHLFVDANAEAFAIDPAGRIATVKKGTVTVWTNGVAKAVVDDIKLTLVSAHDVGFLVFTLDRTLITIGPENRITRFDVGEGALSMARDIPRAAVILDGRAALLDLRDGSVVRFPWAASGAAISPDGRRLAVTAMASSKASILRMQLPREPRDILRWLDGATNATLEPGSTEITWKK